MVLPVGPRNVEEHVPPACHDDRDVEAENKRQWDEAGERLAVQANHLEQSATEVS